MARIRTIKPSFFTDQEIGDLGFAARLFFVGLWCHADKAGRLEDKPRQLEVQILPYDLKKKEIDGERLISELCPKFIMRYEIEGKKYLQIRSWEKHQRPSPQEQESIIPKHDESNTEVVPKYDGSSTKVVPKYDGSSTEVVPKYDESSTEVVPKYDGSSTKDVRKGIGKGREGKGIGKEAPQGHEGIRASSNIPPSFEQVQNYCQERKNNIDPQGFLDYYAARGWMLGKVRMKDWQAAIRTWEKNNGNGKSKSGGDAEGDAGKKLQQKLMEEARLERWNDGEKRGA